MCSSFDPELPSAVPAGAQSPSPLEAAGAFRAWKALLESNQSTWTQEFPQNAPISSPKISPLMNTARFSGNGQSGCFRGKKTQKPKPPSVAASGEVLLCLFSLIELKAAEVLL